MKKTVYITASIIALTILSGCNKDDKCIECHYESSGQNKSSGKVCGTASEINSVAVSWEKEAEDHGTQASCTYY